MASTQRVNITFPVGRMVLGSLYTPSTTDAEGKPLVFKTGPKIGQPRVNYFFALAIAKGAETHWSQTAWGADIWKAGHTAFPQAAQSPTFAWKVEDGDSAVPNKKGRKNCDNEGWAGHWVVKFSGGMAPKVYTIKDGGPVPVLDADFIKPGYFIEVYGNTEGNGSQSQPGVYVNHSMVCFRGFGEEIAFGPNVNEVGFGAAPLPAGASAVPPASAVPMPAAPVTPIASVAAPIPTPLAPPIPTAPAVPVTPNPGFLAVPGAPPVAVPPVTVAGPAPAAIPSPVPAVPAPPIAPAPPASPSSGLRMTALATASYEAYKAANWSDAQMIAAGFATI